ncbi:hypothetical protein GA830_18655 (plasmid) [Mesorhizobium sp. NBSH29]|uniref:hypothetical protein n=1 Tax=Mesorhizobium sp. NBSH29 TaxID=2654249 RepID=UPI0018965155|nr:hypothetical protein [Mesorhizobium sp. NBSH29]QPC88891.1 hypothetical protein GA830_18655 [Mesorhizobium sp. NBSH29]
MRGAHARLARTAGQIKKIEQRADHGQDAPDGNRQHLATHEWQEQRLILVQQFQRRRLTINMR